MFQFSLLLIPCLFWAGYCFQYQHSYSRPQTRQLTSLSGFFDRLKQAFENDSEYAEKEDAGITRKPAADGKKSAFAGRQVYDRSLLGKSWNLSLALNGIPSNSDPSSDLFGVKSTDKGIPVNLCITLLEQGKVEVADNDFTVKDTPGKWQLDADGTTLAFSFACLGFERTIVTKGSLQSVYGGEDTLRTSSSYFVPEGTCLVQTSIIMNESGRLIIAPGKGNFCIHATFVIFSMMFT